MLIRLFSDPQPLISVRSSLGSNLVNISVFKWFLIWLCEFESTLTIIFNNNKITITSYLKPEIVLVGTKDILFI